MDTSARRVLFQVLTGLLAGFAALTFVMRLLFGHLAEHDTTYAWTWDLIGLLLILAFIATWRSLRLSAILLMLWNLGVWILGLFVDRSGGGMPILLAFPVLLLSFFLFKEWLRNRPGASVENTWYVVLQTAMINYAVLYICAALDNIIFFDIVSYWEMPGLMFTLLAAGFLLAFALSWKWQPLAGAVLIIWYAALVVVCSANPELADTGPHNLTGTVLVVQGILYLIFHFAIKKKAH